MEKLKNTELKVTEGLEKICISQKKISVCRNAEVDSVWWVTVRYIMVEFGV